MQFRGFRPRLRSKQRGFINIVTSGLRMPAASSQPVLNKLGVSLGGIGYSRPNQMFLDAFKTAGTGNGFTGWDACATPFSGDNGQAGYLQLDANGYPTSLVANPIPSGGQTFTCVTCYFFVNIAGNYPAPGVTQFYPNGTWRLRVRGSGTIKMYGDCGGTVGSPLSFTFSGGVTDTTLTIPNATNGGMHFCITATDPGATGDYLRDFSLVPSAWTSLYDAGEIFRPDYLATLTNNGTSHVSSARMMDVTYIANELHSTWSNTGVANNLASTPSVGATTATLASAWTDPSGEYMRVFKNGDVRRVIHTVGSTAINWTADPLGGLTNTSPTPLNQYAGYTYHPRVFANENQLTSLFWNNQKGIPLAAQVALCNKVGCDLWYNVPVMADDTYVTAAFTYIFNNLNVNLKCRCEYSNESWNTGQSQVNYNRAVGHFTFPAAGSNDQTATDSWTGYRTAQIAAIAATVYGPTAFASRFIMSMGGQAADTSRATTCLNAPYAVSTGFTAPRLQTDGHGNFLIKAVHIANYMPGWGSPTGQALTDLGNMASQPDNGVAYMDQLMVGNTLSGGPLNGTTVASIPAGGMLASSFAQVSAHVTALASLGTYEIYDYESGTTFVGGGGAGLNDGSAIVNMFVAYTRSSQMAGRYRQYIQGNYAAGMTLQHVFVDNGPAGQNGCWVAMESTMQQISPQSSGPAIWQGMMNFIQFG